MTIGQVTDIAPNAQGHATISEVTTDAPESSSWPAAFDWGLFLLRVGAFMSLFVKHGFGRLTNNAQIPWSSQSPLHAIYTAFADGICSLLVILGLETRWAAAAIFLNMFVSFSVSNHFDFFKHTVASLNNQGEVMEQYMAACLVMMIVGPGRFSLDWKMGLSSFRTFRSRRPKE